MRRPILLVAIVSIFVPRLVVAQERPKEELADRVNAAIERGIRYLKQNQRDGGNWERGAQIAGMGNTGGPTCLAVLAMLNAGLKPDDPSVRDALKYIRALQPAGTYTVGLQTMVFAELNQPQDKPLIQRNVDWLIATAIHDGRQLHGWGYSKGLGHDNSNTQYALLGLHAGKQAGAKIPPGFWEMIRNYYVLSQIKAIGGSGAWGYVENDRSPRLTMTLAGLCGLYIASSELKNGRQKLDMKTGVAGRCGIYEEDDAINAALQWLSQRGNFTFQVGNFNYYCIYGIERTGRLSGRRFLADRDWYREGCEHLLRIQEVDGSWSGHGNDAWVSVSTSFALLFLTKGRTPILISKLAWGQRDEWNNKHHDIKNVVDFASRELFKKMPLAWQVHDGRRIQQDQVLIEVADLLQSPIVYLNGHEAPALTGIQKEILKRYVQEGGFIFAEACCGRKEFADGFRDLMKELFEKDMTNVPADHALYKAFAPVDPNLFPLQRLDLGCKTVVVLSTKPLAGWWEENLYDQKEATGNGMLAFRLAGNIVAYATGMEPPKQRGIRVQLVDDKIDVKLPRGYLKVAQIRHEGDWQPAPAAMRNLMAHLRQEARLDLALTTDPVSITDQKMFQYRFFYIHGRKHFVYGDTDLKNLRANLKSGGLLLGDACCGSKEFDAAFREMAAKLFPDAKLEPIPLNDELYSQWLNGEEIRSVKCRLPRENGSPELRSIPPTLEGIKINNRWVVIYSKYDLGCALEKHPSSDCIGHDHESALRLAGAAVLYYLKH